MKRLNNVCRVLVPSLFLVILLAGCSATKGALQNFNLFSLEDDKQMGYEMALQIKQNSDNEYPLLDTVRYAGAYTHLRGIFNTVLNSGGLTYRNDFNWRIYIINKDVKNAFAVPGGYIFIYKGLIDYLDNESQLAGVIAHEIAHVDRRHSSKQISKQYGTQLLISLFLPQDANEYLAALAAVGNSLVQLSFSRTDEYEADAVGTSLMAKTKYDPYETAGFFKKMMDGQAATGQAFDFLSTHPSDDKRIASIQALCTSLGVQPFTDAQKRIHVTNLNALKTKLKTPSR
jgi:predicted Zn-dependent protease